MLRAAYRGRVRLATFNVLHGRSLDDGLVDADRFRAAVAALDADVVGLQEVDLHQPRSGRLDLTALAAEALGAADHRFAAAVVGTPGVAFRAAGSGAGVGWTEERRERTDRSDEGRRRRESPGARASGASAIEQGPPPLDGEPQYGVALVSRFPVRRWLVHRLPAAPTRAPVLVGGRVLLLPDEPRVLLAAVLDTPCGPVTAATTHLSFVPGWNVRQLRRVVRALRALPGPRVLLGDLNLPAQVARVVSGWRVAARMPTYPAPLPRIQLDHVLVDPADEVRVGAAGTPPTAVSDHRPLFVDLELP
jgi:endonuclease/exonuclease/phosphatase family metal-dependent hydrolase